MAWVQSKGINLCTDKISQDSALTPQNYDLKVMEAGHINSATSFHFT